MSKAPNIEKVGLDDLTQVRFTRITEIFLRLATRSIEKKWKLRNTDLRLLNILDHSDRLSILEISRRAHVDKAWVSRTIATLEQRKLVKRYADPLDSRLVLVALTNKGQVILDKVRPFALEVENTLLDQINDKNFKKMLNQLEANAVALLDKFNNNL